MAMLCAPSMYSLAPLGGRTVSRPPAAADKQAQPCSGSRATEPGHLKKKSIKRIISKPVFSL